MNDLILVIVLLLFFIFTDPFLRCVRVLRLRALAKHFGLSYNKGNFLKITLYKAVEYKRNIIKGRVQGKDVEFFDIVKQRGTGGYYSYSAMSYLYVDGKLLHFPKKTVFDLKRIRPISVTQIRETLLRVA